MENTTDLKGLDIKYGELDIYYPLKFETILSFEKKLGIIEKRFGKFIHKRLEQNIEENNLSLFKEEVEVYKKRAELIKEEYIESVELYGTIYTNSHERFLMFPLKIELSNKQRVWLHAILYIFANNMAILKIELPLVKVNNIPLKKNQWDTYIHKATCVWNSQSVELSTLDEIKTMYLSIIKKECGIELSEYAECLHHIILVDFDGCPDNVNQIPDDVQEELFRTVAASIDEVPYSTYRDEAKEYIKNNSWGTHNIRCILKSTGGCLSIVDRTVQNYWIQEYTREKGTTLDWDEYLYMYMQYVNQVQNNTEFPFIVLLLKRINVLNDIKEKSISAHISNKKNGKVKRKIKYEYWENNIYLSTIQEECCGTVSRQVEEFEKMMPYYIKEGITSVKHEALNIILQEKKNKKEEQYQNFISIGGLALSLTFGLPAIQETVSILRDVCGETKQGVPYITVNMVSVGIWIILNIIILVRLIIFQVKNKDN